MSCAPFELGRRAGNAHRALDLVERIENGGDKEAPSLGEMIRLRLGLVALNAVVEAGGH
jgi:hypothetical protein